jgi:hypothetical protein
MPSDAVNVGLALTAAVGLGTIYVLLHEKKRKRKKLERALKDQPITKDLLLKILNKAAENSKVVVDKIRVEVRKVQVARNLSDEQTMQLFQQNFEHSLDQLISHIRSGFKVTEKAMDSAFKQHQADPDVQQAIQNMRVLSANASSAPPPPSSGGSSATGGTALPASLTRERCARLHRPAHRPLRMSFPTTARSTATSSTATRPLEWPYLLHRRPAPLARRRLKEIMTFNATTLEKELRPIKEEMARQRKLGKQPQVDPQALMSLQVTPHGPPCYHPLTWASPGVLRHPVLCYVPSPCSHALPLLPPAQPSTRPFLCSPPCRADAHLAAGAGQVWRLGRGGDGGGRAVQRQDRPGLQGHPRPDRQHAQQLPRVSP